MEHDRWQRLWSLFHGALERPAGRERASYLAGSCGSDAALRAELDARFQGCLCLGCLQELAPRPTQVSCGQCTPASSA